MLLRYFRGHVTRLPKSTVWLRCCSFDGNSGNNENIDAIVDHAAASFLDFASRKDVKLYRTIMTKAASMHSNAERLAYVGPATLRARIDAKWFAKWIWDILQENGNVPSPQADAMYATDEHVTKFRTTVLPLFVKDDSAELMMTEIDPLLRKLPRGIADDVISALRRIAKIEESDDNRSTSINTEFLKFNRTHKPTFVDILSYLNVHSKPTRSVRKKVDQPSAQFREAVVEYIRSIRRDAVTSPDVSCGNNTADSESAYSESSSTMEESLAPPPQAAGVDTSNPRRRGRSINASTIFACNVKVREKSSVLAQHSSALTEEDDEAVAEEISQENRALYCSRTGKEMPLHPLDESFAPDVEYDGVFDTVFEPPRPTNLNEKPEDEPDDRVLVDEDIMVKARATAPARRKIMIINLPVTCDTSDVRKAFRKCGKITDITLCHSHNPLWDKVKELQEATKVKKRGRAPKVSAKDAAIKAAINSSDVYAFFKAYKDSYDEIMCPDLKVFGMCIQVNILRKNYILCLLLPESTLPSG